MFYNETNGDRFCPIIQHNHTLLRGRLYLLRGCWLNLGEGIVCLCVYVFVWETIRKPVTLLAFPCIFYFSKKRWSDIFTYRSNDLSLRRETGRPLPEREDPLFVTGVSSLLGLRRHAPDGCDLHGGLHACLALGFDLVWICSTCQGLEGAFHALIE